MSVYENLYLSIEIEIGVQKMNDFHPEMPGFNIIVWESDILSGRRIFCSISNLEYESKSQMFGWNIKYFKYWAHLVHKNWRLKMSPPENESPKSLLIFFTGIKNSAKVKIFPDWMQKKLILSPV